MIYIRYDPFVEELGQPGVADGSSLANMLRPRRAVLDTGPLLNDVMKSSALGAPSPLCTAIQSRLVTAFAATHVWAEVPRNLEGRADAWGLDYRRLESVWWTWYVPNIRFVDCSRVASTRESEVLAARDPDDTDTLKLFGLVAPAVLIAEDPDLLASGLAYEQWRDFYGWASETARGKSLALGVSFALVLTGHGAAAGFRAVRRAMATPTGRLALFLGGGALAAMLFGLRHRFRTAWVEGRDERRQVFEDAMNEFAALWARLAAADQLWRSAERGLPGASLTSRVAVALASAEAPMTRRELVSALKLEDQRSSLDRLGWLLYSNRAFVHVPPNRWQLGCENADLSIDWKSPMSDVGSLEAGPR